MSKRKTQPVNAEEVNASPIESQEGTSAQSQQLGVVLKNNDYDKFIASLDDADKTRYRAVADVIAVGDASSILDYGSDVNAKIESNADALLNSVRTSNLGDLSKEMEELLKEMDLYNAEDIVEGNSFIKFLSKFSIFDKFVQNRVSKEIQNNSIADNMEHIIDKLKVEGDKASTGWHDLQVLKENTVEYLNNLNELIIGLKLKREQILAEQQEVINSVDDDDISTYDMSSYNNTIDAIDAKLNDLMIAEHMFKMDMEKYNQLQKNNLSIVQKSETLIKTAIPMWKGQLVGAVMIKEQSETARVQARVSEAINQQIIEGSKVLKETTIQVAKNMEAPMLESATLKAAVDNLISAINEREKIANEGQREREKCEQQMKDDIARLVKIQEEQTKRIQAKNKSKR